MHDFGEKERTIVRNGSLCLSEQTAADMNNEMIKVAGTCPASIATDWTSPNLFFTVICKPHSLEVTVRPYSNTGNYIKIRFNHVSDLAACHPRLYSKLNTI